MTESKAAEAAEFLRSRFNATVSYGRELHEPCSSRQRARLISEYLQDSEIDCLWAGRGGEGTADILPFLEDSIDLLSNLTEPKIVIGSSDFTALLLFCTKIPSMTVIHGPNLAQLVRLNKASITLNSLEKLFIGERLVRLYPLTPLNRAAEQRVPVIADGCIGGNLTLLALSISDIYEFEADGKIVFLEDWQEKGYAIDRNLKYLYRIGKFRNARALILGDLYHKLALTGDNCLEQEVAYLRERLKEFAFSLEIPVFMSSSIGHGAESIPIPFQWRAKFDFQADPCLILFEKAN